MTHRLSPTSGEVIDRDRELSFRWNGKKLKGYAGDTIASALMANGEHVISRSMKYHRPRGLLTFDYWDPNTTVQVGDEPNVRASHRKLEDGMAVSAQNVWPSLKYDVKAANGLVGRFLTAGFYYKTFMKSVALWPRYEHVLASSRQGHRRPRHASWPLRQALRPSRRRRRWWRSRRSGGGYRCGRSRIIGDARRARAPARRASGLGFERGPRGGGRSRRSRRGGRGRDPHRLDGHRPLRGQLGRHRPAQPPRRHRTADQGPAKTLIVAAGTIERPYVFEGNDLPGVMTSGAVQRLVRMYGVKPGTQAVVFTANESGDSAVQALQDAGVAIARVVDGRESERIVSASGSKTRVREVSLHDGAVVPCDLLVTAVGWTTPTSLLNMAGDRPVYDPVAARFFPDGPPDNVLATGGMIGDGSRDELIAHGRATGELAAGEPLLSIASGRHGPSGGGRRTRTSLPHRHAPAAGAARHPSCFARPPMASSTTPKTSPQDLFSAAEEGLIGRAHQALHDRNDGSQPGQARNRQHRRRAR